VNGRAKGGGREVKRNYYYLRAERSEYTAINGGREKSCSKEGAKSKVDFREAKKICAAGARRF